MANNQSSSPTLLPLSQRILSNVLLAATVVSTVYSLFFVLFVPINYFRIFISLVCSVTFYAFYRGSKSPQTFNKIAIAFVVFSLLILSVGWFIMEGVTGGTGYFHVTAIAFFILLMPLRYRYWLVGATITAVVVLFALEYHFPSYVVHHPSPLVRSFILLADIVFSIITVAWILSATKMEYEKEQQKTQAQKQAVLDAHAAKSRFLANISHELRTPMNGVMGISALLSNTSLSQEQQEYVHTIMASSNRLLNIINQILDYSKTEAGKTKLHIKNFSLKQCIKEAQQINSVTAAKKQLKLDNNIPNSIPDILSGDPEKLQQILVNLIGNAVRYSHEGSIVLDVKAIKTTNTSTTLLFSLKDTGIGIPASKIPYLFDAFTQVDDSSTRPEGGTGLGLAICQQLVLLMGGKIWVESTLGKGSTFFFQLSFDITQDQTPLTNHTPKFSTNPTPKNEVDILIVEDDNVNRFLAIRFLEKMGYKPNAVTNGQEALDALKEKDYPIIFMDIQMPVLDGLKATEIIRKEHQYQPIIIAMTANAMTENKLLCEIVGMNDFIEKPIRLPILEEVLEKWTQTI